MYDVTLGNQFGYHDFHKVLGVYQAIPVKTDVSGIFPVGHPLVGQFFPSGTIYSFHKFQEAAAYQGYSMLDWEPETVQSGVDPNFRELDPKYAPLSQIQIAHAEYATAINLVRADAKRNNAKIGYYDFNTLIYRRNQDIINNYASWQADLESVINLEAVSGETLVDIIKDLGGQIYWSCYIIDAWNNSTFYPLQLLMQERISDSLNALGVPNTPLLRYRTIQYLEPYPPLLNGMLEFARNRYGNEWSTWGFPGEFPRNAMTMFLGDSLKRVRKINKSKKTQKIYAGATALVDTSTNGSPRPIQPGRCINADGSNDYVNVNNSLNMSGLSGWAVACSFNRDDTGTKGLMGRQNQWGISVGSNVQLYVRDGGLVDRTGIGGNVSTGVWSNVIVNNSGNNYKVYLNSQLVINTNYTGLATGINGADALLSLYAGASSPFDGKVFNTIVWDRTLSDANIRSYLNNDFNKLPAAKRWYKMDESQGTFCYDSASGGIHGNYVNTQASIFYTGSDVPYSFQNEVGYTNGTNLIVQSQDLSVSPWILANSTVGQDNTYGPDGKKKAWIVYQNVDAVADNIVNFTNAPSGLYNFECYVKSAAGFKGCRFGLNNVSSNFTQVTPSIVSGPGSVAGTTVITVTGLSTTEWTKVRLAMTTGTTVLRAFIYPSIIGQQTSGNAVHIYQPQLYPSGTQFSGYVETKENYIYGPVPKKEHGVNQDTSSGLLQYRGRVPYNARKVHSHCGYFPANSTQGVLFGPTTMSIASNNLSLEYSMKSTQTGTLKYTLYLYDGTDTYLFAALGTVANQISFFDGTWRNLATAPHDGKPHRIKYDIVGNGLTLYIDGVASAFTTITNRTISPATYVTIGGNFDAIGAVTYSGELWDLKLTSSGETVLHVPFSEGSGGYIYDIAGGRRGNLTGVSHSTFWSHRQDTYHHNIDYGYNLVTGVRVPAKLTRRTDATGGQIQYPAGNYHNGAETRIDFTNGIASPYSVNIAVGSGLLFETGTYALAPFGFNVNQDKLHFHASINLSRMESFFITGTTRAKYPLLSQSGGRTIIGISGSSEQAANYNSTLLYTEIDGLCKVGTYPVVITQPTVAKWQDVDVIIQNNQFAVYLDNSHVFSTGLTGINNSGNFILGANGLEYYSGYMCDVFISKNDQLQAYYPLYKNGLDMYSNNHLSVVNPKFAIMPAQTGYAYNSSITENISRSNGNKKEYNLQVYDYIQELNAGDINNILNMINNNISTIRNQNSNTTISGVTTISGINFNKKLQNRFRR